MNMARRCLICGSTICAPWCDANLPPEYNSLKEIIEKRYGTSVGSGRHRLTFASNRVVIKLPRNISGAAANEREFNVYKANHGVAKCVCDDARLARCRLVRIMGLPVIIMEKLNISHKWQNAPEWAGSFDTMQVGRDKRGTWKAYDYA